GRFGLRAGGKGHRRGLLARLCTYPFQSRNESDPGPALLFWSPRQRSLRYAGAAPSELLLPADLALRRDLQPQVSVISWLELGADLLDLLLAAGKVELDVDAGFSRRLDGRPVSGSRSKPLDGQAAAGVADLQVFDRAAGLIDDEEPDSGGGASRQ